MFGERVRVSWCFVVVQIDLTGGYYDAGDNVKYGLPMAFTVTMLAWNVIQYRHHLQSAAELGHALEAIKWGTDYFVKAHPEPDVLWGEVTGALLYVPDSPEGAA